MPWPSFPSLIAPNYIVVIRNIWGAGSHGGRTVVGQEVVGQFLAVITAGSGSGKTSGGAHAGNPEGYDAAFGGYLNRAIFTVHFQYPNIPPAPGLKPLDTIVGIDDARVTHVLEVTTYYPLANGTGTYVAACVERS